MNQLFAAAKQFGIAARPSRELIAWLFALPVGAVFLLAGIGKWNSPDAMIAVFARYGVEANYGRWIVSAFSGMEVGLAVLWILGWTSRQTTVATVALLGLFSIYLASLIAGGSVHSCACFGDWLSGLGTQKPWAALARNLVLFLCLAPVIALQFGQRSKAGY